MTHLSDRINSLSESQTIAMARKSRELQAQGIDIISLSLGEPDFKTPDVIKEAAKKAIDSDFSYYTHVSGYLELRKAVCEKFLRDNKLKFEPDQIVITTGAKQAIANTILSLINPGDEVLVPMPYWVSYIEIIKLAEGIPVIIPTSIENNFKVTPAQLAKAMTPKTRMLMFSTPCNPTGTVYSKEELRGIAEVIAKQPECYIMSDEIYEHINFVGGHESMAQFDFIYDRTITINGVSKGFAMTGWRGGILAAPKWIAAACDKMQGQFTSATCSITQKAMHAAMLMDPRTTDPMRDAFHRRRDLMLKAMKEIPGMKLNVPDGAFYLFP
ncbi:MAG TPA: pyridoxal phosphate-dependent aminotransferase, partial [Bacteroidia bacterium]|nr:pyridoxal phosphate-dependent aminotransferase [Bacteroidia bacterium]